MQGTRTETARSHGEPGLMWIDDLLEWLEQQLGWVGSLIGGILVWTVLWPAILVGSCWARFFEDAAQAGSARRPISVISCCRRRV